MLYKLRIDMGLRGIFRPVHKIKYYIIDAYWIKNPRVIYEDWQVSSKIFSPKIMPTYDLILEITHDQYDKLDFEEFDDLSTLPKNDIREDIGDRASAYRKAKLRIALRRSLRGL